MTLSICFFVYLKPHWMKKKTNTFWSVAKPRLPWLLLLSLSSFCTRHNEYRVISYIQAYFGRNRSTIQENLYYSQRAINKKKYYITYKEHRHGGAHIDWFRNSGRNKPTYFYSSFSYSRGQDNGHSREGHSEGPIVQYLEMVFSRACALVWIGFQVIPMSHMAITIDTDEKGVILLDFWRCVSL